MPKTSDWSDYEMCSVKIKSINLVKDLGVTVPSNLKFSQQCNESLIKTNRMLGFIERNFSFKNTGSTTFA